ncbi:MAG: hypothetical protein ABGW95_00345 [Candidatus Poseidoniia archaeon]
MDFGTSPGGPHSATGYNLMPGPAGQQTTFRAEQSAIGCLQGVGAAAPRTPRLRSRLLPRSVDRGQG